jgi:hypothetical protein
MKELFSCAHLKPVLHQNLQKPVQGLVDPVGVDSLAPGYLVGEHRPLIAKEGQALGRMDFFTRPSYLCRLWLIIPNDIIWTAESF